MVVSTNDAVKRYDGNGVATVFNAPFVASAAWLRVTLFPVSGAAVVQDLGTDYTYDTSTRQITTVSFTPQTDEVLVIERITPLTQPSQFNPLTELPAATIEGALDRLTLIAQDLDARLNRAVLIGPNVEDEVLNDQLIEAVLTLVPLSDEIVDLALISGDIVTVAGVSADIAALIAALNAGASPFSDQIVVAGAAPRVTLAETTGAVSGAERVEFQLDGGVFRARARSAADAAVETLWETAYDASGATEHRLRVAAANALTVNGAGALVAGLLSSTRHSWSIPNAAVGSAETLTSVDDIVDSGLYYVDPTALGRPATLGTQACYVYHFRQYANNYAMQLAFRDAALSSTIFMRQRQGGAWGTWGQIGASRGSGSVVTTSGTQITFDQTSTDVTEIDLILEGVRLSTADNILVRLQTSPGGLITSGYVASEARLVNAGAVAFSTYTTEMARLTRTASGDITEGRLNLKRALGTNVWSLEGTVTTGGTRQILLRGEIFGLANPVSGVRLVAAGGNFNLGNAYCNWRS
jgi:hypothetical protein